MGAYWATTPPYAALFLVPFMCVWSGFSLGGIYGSQIAKGQFDPSVWLFGIPFVLGTILFGSFAAMTVCGKVELNVCVDHAEVFIGFGRVGSRRRFQWSQIKRAVEGSSVLNYPGQATQGICLEGVGMRIHFGTGINEERRVLLARVLRRMLVKAKR
jgi:hypothetical protein